MTRARTAVVVGSGPNGLAAAVRLAGHGLKVRVLEAADTPGGGARTSELTVPGLLHDVCSAVHPFGVASPYLASLPLVEHGLRWRWPEVDLVHPLDDGSAGVLVGDVDRTAAGMGVDRNAWRRVFGPIVTRFDDLAPDVLGPLLRVPSHPLALARFGLRAGLPATVLAKAFRTPQARALLMGCAAHLFQPLNRPLSASVGVMLVAAGHRHGWPVAEGGSQAITSALASVLAERGGTIECNAPVTSLADLPGADVTLFDTTPQAVAEILGDRLGGRRARRYRSFAFGPAAFKVDIAVRQGIPWTNESARRAGTVHLGGGAGEVAAAEAAVVAGRMPQRPFVLVGQQYLADPTRSVDGVHPIWAYAHVPAGYEGDATAVVLDRIESYAPGFRSRIVAAHSTSATGYESYNPNYVGGDIGGGANTPLQMIGRPLFAADPYATGVDGMYLCSASTPPGAGVHGMCGAGAAASALRGLGISVTSLGGQGQAARTRRMWRA
ncbi:phytoene desaturase family protein [Rhodococcus maanshanensis]|uniref:Phytoene dehydrogenase-related protein n=1 Tax=Rhodococcus maanshanensis TaxID=183556 RepID=A0A1H7V1H8_9NOCA|nr:NAD(P)/FAD-dependent oxidoreductase [Rhodococcus maanshanensis]SEM02768.1 Phytoene dehydrogenase-related protein [Rhodococcus maanshanensis]